MTIHATNIILDTMAKIPQNLTSAEQILELSTRLIHQLNSTTHHHKINKISDLLTELGVYSKKNSLHISAK